MAVAYSQLSRFLHNPGPVHMAAAKRALVYVQGTHDQGLSYCDPGAENRNILTWWVDSDFAADADTRRSVTGYGMALNGAPISWLSCRQGGVTLSSSEAEYVAASAVAQENAYLRALLSGQIAFTGLSPTRVPRSSFLFFSCFLHLVSFALTLKFLLFLGLPSRLFYFV